MANYPAALAGRRTSPIDDGNPCTVEQAEVAGLAAALVEIDVGDETRAVRHGGLGLAG